MHALFLAVASALADASPAINRKVAEKFIDFLRKYDIEIDGTDIPYHMRGALRYWGFDVTYVV